MPSRDKAASETVALGPSYRTTCPYCNGALYPIAFTPASAPWVCVICHCAWWAAELSEEARAQFRPQYCDFGFGSEMLQLHDLVLEEWGTAELRGTSVRPDQVQLLPLYVLQRLPQEGDFGDLVKQEITRKGKA